MILIRCICSKPVISNLFDVLCVSSSTRYTVKYTLDYGATKHRGVDAFFTQGRGMNDYVTNA